MRKMSVTLFENSINILLTVYCINDIGNLTRKDFGKRFDLCRIDIFQKNRYFRKKILDKQSSLCYNIHVPLRNGSEYWGIV